MPPLNTLGLTFLIAGLAGSAGAATLAGETYFKRNCASCHTADAAQTSGAGPGLGGVLGRRLGAAPGFNYSNALSQAGAKGTTWTAFDLDSYLANPAKAMPGTSMPVNIAAPADRAAVIAYLATLTNAANAAPVPVVAANASTSTNTNSPWSDDAPGKNHRVVFDALPAPFASASAGNSPKVVARPEGALPAVPPGFRVSVFANDPDKGRLMIKAPNGDVFVSDPGKGQIKVLRSSNGETADTIGVFASGLERPFGIAFYPSGPNPRYLYVANVNAIVRLPYANGALLAGAPAETVVPFLTAEKGGHSSRTLTFSNDDKVMFLSIGSATNVADTMVPAPPMPLPEWEKKQGLGAAWGDELDRAVVLAFDPQGGARRTFATGLRNCVGMVVYPPTGDLLCSVNERDKLGDNLPPDYVTRVKAGSFFGWPWFYIGNHEDPRLAGARPDLKDKITLPDVLLQAHSAPLGMAPYLPLAGAKHAFPKAYDGDVFVAMHGSWNRALRTGSKVVRIRMNKGVPTGEYQDFMTGMIISDKQVWGRPSSVLVAQDGALLVNDDASGTIWRIVPDKR
ncbi:MAG: PQQ-dependent sugar dehydrogenase [Massilia sp.]|nr:PQQ-dependent sugar dehydrogenase [Massilia sp.]